MNKISSTTPMTAQAAGDASRKRRAFASAAGVPAGCALPLTPTYDHDLIGND